MRTPIIIFLLSSALLSALRHVPVSTAIESFGTPWHHAGAASKAAEEIAREHRRQERERRERHKTARQSSAAPRKKTMEEAIESAKRMKRVQLEDGLLSDGESLSSFEDEESEDEGSLLFFDDDDGSSDGGEEVLFGMPRLGSSNYARDSDASSCDMPGFVGLMDGDSAQGDSDSDNEEQWRKKRVKNKKLRKAIKKKTRRKKGED